MPTFAADIRNIESQIKNLFSRTFGIKRSLIENGSSVKLWKQILDEADADRFPLADPEGIYQEEQRKKDAANGFPH